MSPRLWQSARPRLHASFSRLSRGLLLALSALLLAAAACAPGPSGPGSAARPTAAPTPAAVPTSTAAPSPAAAVATPTARPTQVPTAAPAATQAMPTAAASAPPAALTPRAEAVLSMTASVRSLPVKGAVPLANLPRDQVRTYLAKLFEKDHAREDLEQDQASLVLLDLLKASDNLYELWLGLLTDQLLGFYEFDEKRMTLVGAGNDLTPMDEITLAHEYVHALQDQHFGVGATLDKLRRDSERSSAMQALTEGDATLAMSLYARQNLTADQLARIVRDPSATASAAKLAQVPVVLQVSLVFPYEQGLSFVTALAQSGGWRAVDRAYSNPPTTTEQIMHPEKYLTGEGAVEVNAPDLAPVLGPGWSLWDDDALGELGSLAYLIGNGIQADRAARAAAGWGGDRLLLFRDASGRHALVSLSAWDTARDATEFFGAVRDLRAAKGSVAPRGDGRLEWAAPGRAGYAAMSGSQVVLVISPDAEITKKVAERLASP